MWYRGQHIVSLSDFSDVRAIWGFNYPAKDQVCVVMGVRKHPVHNFYLLDIGTCEVELCDRNFVPLDDILDEEIAELVELTKLVSI